MVLVLNSKIHRWTLDIIVYIKSLNHRYFRIDYLFIFSLDFLDTLCISSCSQKLFTTCTIFATLLLILHHRVVKINEMTASRKHLSTDNNRRCIYTRPEIFRSVDQNVIIMWRGNFLQTRPWLREITNYEKQRLIFAFGWSSIYLQPRYLSTTDYLFLSWYYSVGKDFSISFSYCLL